MNDISPQEAAKIIAAITNLLLVRVNIEKRQNYINKIKQKMTGLKGEVSLISNKSMPSGAAIGQTVSLVKNLLNGKPPGYIASVLNELIYRL